VAVVAALCGLSLVVVGLSGRPARAQVTDTTTTVPAPDTTTTTAPAPDKTTTTAPPSDTTTTTVPPSDSTTTTTAQPGSDSTTTSSTSTLQSPSDPAAKAGSLDPAEALVPQPEFAALSAHQRELVQEFETATDAYALRRIALVDLAHQVAAAEAVLQQAQADENAAVRRELSAVAEAVLFHSHLAAPAGSVLDVSVSKGLTTPSARGKAHETGLDRRLAALRRRFEDDQTKARLARTEAETRVSDLRARLADQTQAVADAWSARTAAESAVEHELGPDAVRARPDGITATLVAAQAGQPDPVVLGGLAQPIPGAALASPFGLRNDPLSAGAGFHPGLDFAAVSGTPIHAAGAGVVVTAGDCGGYGNCVVIDHGASLATVYAHQSTILVLVGQHVDAGQVIGLVGSTGLATGPHLHFEVRLHGLPIDPLLALLPD
jgi:murein DD-endopeptidase MepM/ murein hydrolase activator NlpD